MQPSGKPFRKSVLYHFPIMKEPPKNTHWISAATFQAPNLTLQSALCHFCHPNKAQVNDGEAELKPFKYLLAKSTLSNTRSSVRHNFILEWLADNLGRLAEKWRIFPCFTFEEKPSPYLQWISLRTLNAHQLYQQISQAWWIVAHNPALLANGREGPGRLHSCRTGVPPLTEPWGMWVPVRQRPLISQKEVGAICWTENQLD